MNSVDTIVARATAAGASGVAVVRVSGAAVQQICKALCGKTLAPRLASLTGFVADNGEPIDTGIALFFPAPHSYTGEDVLELQCHGSPVVVKQLLQRCVQLGARMARPGEFTERAFLNGQLDLAQAEAVADLIASSTDAAARAASRSLQGEFSNQVLVLSELITQLRVFVESAIDFPDEEIDFLNEGEVEQKTRHLLDQIKHLRAQASQGVILRDGLNLVLIGRPNVGKSSLLNRLAGSDSAIVSAQPGTTRDVLREHIDVDGLPVHIFDTAGLRDDGGEIEREGMRRAQEKMHQADHILLLVDATDPDQPDLTQLPQGIAVTRVVNKIDLTGESAQIHQDPAGLSIHLSAKTGEGIDLLSGHLKSLAGLASASEGSFSARQRHIDAIDQAIKHVHAGEQELTATGSGELLAEELRLAHSELGKITGAVSADDLLGEIFSSFCIGK